MAQTALKHLLDEHKMRSSETPSSIHHQTSLKLDHDAPLLPPNLLSQQDDAVKDDELVEELEAPKSSQKNETVNEVENNGNENIEDKEIIKELREIQKQNRKTHWLLSAMIVLTLTWQLSEVSLLWKFKQGITGLTNPFKAIGSMFKRKRGCVEESDTLPISLPSSLLGSAPSASDESIE